MKSVNKFLSAGTRAASKGVLQQSLERGVSLRFFIRRTGALLVERLEEFLSSGLIKDGAQDFLAAFPAQVAVPEGARVLEIAERHAHEFGRGAVRKISAAGY